MNTINAGDLVRLTDKARNNDLYPPSMKGDMVADVSYKRGVHKCVDVLCEDGEFRCAEVNDLMRV